MALPDFIRVEKKFNAAFTTFLKKGKFSFYFIICDSNTLQFCLAPLISAIPLLQDAEVIELDPGEENKAIEIAASVWETLTQLGADKKSLVINLGGGIVGDIGGFCASVYKRGIPFVNLPTSLLAMADASVGGKNGINFAGIKNLIGTITQPQFVYINSGFLNTLPPRHLLNGLAEIIKIALIADKSFFNALEKVSVDHQTDLTGIVKRSVELKYAIVRKDPYEKSFRKILNFGHTFGHAVESLSFTTSGSLLHGEAIAIGMAMETCLCLQRKRIKSDEFNRIISLLKKNYHLIPLSDSDLKQFFRFFDQDKKHSGGEYFLALINTIGKCDPEVKVKRAHIESAIQLYNSTIAV